MRVTEGVRKIIVEWHGKGVPPEETARSLRIPIDEVKAIILQAHPASAPENPPASATIEEKVKESQQTVENKPFPANPPRRERLRESKSPHLSAEARIVQQASIAPAKRRGMMEQRTCAACGKAAGDANLCKECVKDWAKRLAWLLKAGMPALQQIAYKQATTRERSPRHGNRAYAAPPVNEAAQALYSAVETHLQLTGGMLGVKPIGHDRYDRPRTLMQWADITRLLLHHMPDLARLDTAGDLYADLIRLSEKVETATTHAGERRLVGVCPNCLNTKGDDDEPIRTPIYAARSARYTVCPECGAWLDLKRVRLEYLRSAGLMHITRTQADAARWVRENTGVSVTGKDLANWRSRGKMPSTRRIDRHYWEWNIMELLACAQDRAERDGGDV